MEQVCHEETVPPCQSQEQVGTGVTAVGHGPWWVWVNITRNKGWWRQSLSICADSYEEKSVVTGAKPGDTISALQGAEWRSEQRGVRATLIRVAAEAA